MNRKSRTLGHCLSHSWPSHHCKTVLTPPDNLAFLTTEHAKTCTPPFPVYRHFQFSYLCQFYFISVGDGHCCYIICSHVLCRCVDWLMEAGATHHGCCVWYPSQHRVVLRGSHFSGLKKLEPKEAEKLCRQDLPLFWFTKGPR